MTGTELLLFILSIVLMGWPLLLLNYALQDGAPKSGESFVPWLLMFGFGAVLFIGLIVKLVMGAFV